jgi:type II secretion system protein D
VVAAALVLLAGTAVGWQESSPAPSSPSPSSSPSSPSRAPETPASAPVEEPSRPEPAPVKVAEKPPAPAPAPAAAPAKPKPAGPVYKTLPNGRRIIDGPPTALAFKNVTVDQIVPFIVEATGKVVMPQQDVLTRKVTILNNQPIPREQALDLVIEGLQQNGVAAAEGESTIKLRDIAELTREDVPHISPDESTLSRTDGGWFAEKVYQLKHTTAKAMGDVLKNALPDYAKMTVSDESNSIAILGNISLLQRVERLINSLDRPSLGAMQTQTFALKYTDANLVKDNINELFSVSGQTGAGANRRNQGGNNQGNRGGQNNQQPQFRFPGQQGQDQSTVSSGEIRVTANTQQNSVTVVADPSVLDQIRDLVENKWDLPVPKDVAVTKVYELKYTDPVKVANMLNALMGRSTSSTSTGGGGGGGNQFGQFGQQQGGAPTVAQGAQRLQNMFTIQPMADSGKLAVIAKSVDNLVIIDDIIKQVDQPQTVGLPAIVELKHASAEDLAEQLNALLSQDGTLAAVTKSESGLTSSTGNTSPFASANANTAATPNSATNNPDAVTPGTMQFWWQRSRTPTDRHPASNLIGQLRIVPVWRQNALMVIAPPEYKESIVKLITDLDKPGRQVLIAAIVAEVSREDATELGLRWSSQALTPTNPDNSFSVGNSMTGTKNQFINSLFDTSVLTTNANLNIMLNALAQKTDVSILSEPKIFTSDNQEADFFDGQDVPFVTNSQTTTTGLVQSFDYRAVGIQLRARPRITVQGDVDLKVNLELSSIVPGQTLFGGFIVDRRETTTQLIVKDKQTIVISGILRSELSDITRKVPLLGDIPLLGAIFRSKDKTVKNTELLVFITPIVVVNTLNDEVNASYNERLNKIRTRLQDSEPDSLKGPPETELRGHDNPGPQMAPDNGAPGPHPAPEPK